MILNWLYLSDPAYVRRNSEIIAIKNLTASLLPFAHGQDSDKNALNLLLREESKLFGKIDDMEEPMIVEFLKNTAEKLSEAFGSQANKTKKLEKLLEEVKVTNSGDKNNFAKKVKTKFFDKIKRDSKGELFSKNIANRIQKSLKRIKTEMTEALTDATKIFQSSTELTEAEAKRALNLISVKAKKLLREDATFVQTAMSFTSEDDLKSMNLDTRNIYKNLSDMLKSFEKLSDKANHEIEKLSNKTNADAEMRSIFYETKSEISSTLTRTNNNIQNYHPMWSLLTFTIMFMPGPARRAVPQEQANGMSRMGWEK